jgi:hypothetical protein
MSYVFDLYGALACWLLCLDGNSIIMREDGCAWMIIKTTPSSGILFCVDFFWYFIKSYHIASYCPQIFSSYCIVFYRIISYHVALEPYRTFSFRCFFFLPKFFSNGVIYGGFLYYYNMHICDMLVSSFLLGVLFCLSVFITNIFPTTGTKLRLL